MDAELVDRVQNDGYDENLSHILPPCRNNSHRWAGFQRTAQRRGGRFCCASRSRQFPDGEFSLATVLTLVFVVIGAKVVDETRALMHIDLGFRKLRMPS